MKTSVRRKRPDAVAVRAVPIRALPWLAALALGLASLNAAAQPDSDSTHESGRAQSGSARSATVPVKQKQQAIRELIELTDAARLQDIFSQQFIARIANAVAVFRPDIDAQTMAIIEDEARAVIREHIESGDALYSVLYPVYEKHFNLIELNQLLKFYQSPLGQKLVRVSPELLTETLSLGRQWALSLVPEIMQRVATRLNAADSASANSR